MSMKDLALLTRKIVHDYPEYYALFAETEFTWEKIRQPNRNPLLDTFDGADGLKTGHTEESGYGLVGSAIKKWRTPNCCHQWYAIGAGAYYRSHPHDAHCVQ